MTGPAEAEAARMAAVLSASYPEGWRFRAMYWCVPGGNGALYRASAGIERFDGVYWSYEKAVSGEWSGSKDGAFGSMLSKWASKGSWAETVRGTTLPWPPAGSAAELCLKLDMAG